jgi:CRISPR-associated protein Csm2
MSLTNVQQPDWIKYGSKKMTDRNGRDCVEPVKQIDFDPIKFGIKDDKLFDITAESVAKAISQDGRTVWSKQESRWDKKANLINNKSTQLRKFYDELVMWHDKIFLARDENGKTSAEIRQKEYVQSAPFIKMLCAKVAYAKEREHVSEGFERLFTHVIRAISNPDTLKQAKLFIEAFLGFYKAEEK